eukprot:scaffold224268_cov30-Tisochrysis_lutea.AAC.2
MPVRDHDLIRPSSPAVAREVPSCDQRTTVTAPWCALASDFSIRPVREMSLNEPSVQPTTKTSVCALAVAEGCQSKPVQ